MIEISLSLTLNLHVYVPRGPATHISWSGQWLPRKSYGASVFAPALRALNYPGSEKHPWEADVFDTISQSPEKNTPDIDSNHLSEEYENRWCISRIQAWSYWSHEKLRLKVIIVKGREGELAPVPAVPDNLFSLLYSNWSQECWWDQRLLIVSALSASGGAFVLFHFIYFDGREKGSVMQHACPPWHTLGTLPLPLMLLTLAQSWNCCLLLLPSAPFLFRPYPCLPWPFLVTKIWSRVRPWLDAPHCVLMDGKKKPTLQFRSCVYW